MATLPPALPSESMLSGLGGTPPAVETTPQVGQAEEPDPGQTVAQHIMAALGGSTGHPMDWARGIVAGGLSGAASVGKQPEGAGWLHGASQGIQGTQELQRQKQLDEQNRQKQQQEMQLKQKADARAEQELQIHLEDTKVQRAMWTAQIAGETQRQNQDAFKFEQYKKLAPLEVEKARTDYQEQQDKYNEARGEMIGLVEAVTGKNIDSFPLVKTNAELTPDDAKQAASGDIFPVHNGESHSAGEDGVGVYKIPGDVWDRELPKDFNMTRPDGESMTASAGTPVAELAGIIAGKMKAAGMKEKEIMDALDVQMKQAQIRHENQETNQSILAGQLVKKQLEDPDSLTPKELHTLQHSGQGESSKSQKDYNTFLQSANSIEGSIRASRNGNELAAAIIPLQGTLFITTAEGVKRINQTELEGVAGAGDITRRGENAYQKFVKGDTSEGTKRDLANLIEVYKKAKYQQYLNNEDLTATNYRLGDKQRVFDIEGKPTTLGEARAKLASGQAPTPAGPNTHTFNAQAWAAANPGKDVNAAIAQAKQQGYEVKQ